MRDDGDTATLLTELVTRIDRLEAVHELTTLRAEFHRSLNNCQWDSLADLFTDDAYLNYGEYGQAHGSKEVLAYYSELPEKIRIMRDATAISLKNFIHGHQINVLGNGAATGVCFFEEQIRFNKDSEVFSSVGQFSDSYVRKDGRWYFSAVELDHYWVVPDNEGWFWPW